MKPKNPSFLRSVLFAPGNDAKKATKAFRVGADAVVLDLEDSVPFTEKLNARTCVVAALMAPRSCRSYVRINPVGGSYWESDLDVVIGPWLDGITIPKVEDADEVRAADAYIARLETEADLPSGGLDLILLVETARGVDNADEIAAASKRSCALALGGADYTLDLGLEWTTEEHELAYARARLTHASRAVGIEPPIDTPRVELRDIQQFRSSAKNGRRMGFQGKLCIHPAQVAHCNEIFSPSAAEVRRAREILAAFEMAEAAGSASFQLHGSLVDYAVAHKARRVLAAADQIRCDLKA